MKLKKVHFIFLFLNLNFLLFSQNEEKNDSIPVVQIQITNSNYKDFIVNDKYLYALNSEDILVLIDLETDKRIKTFTRIFALSKNKKNEIVICTRSSTKNLTNNSSKKIKFKGLPYYLLYDEFNNEIVISDEGVYYSGKMYFPENFKSIFKPIITNQKQKKNLRKPDLVYLDKEERLWITYDNGEFGEDVLFFDLKNKKFYEEEYLMVDINYSKEKVDSKEYFRRLYSKHSSKIKLVEQDTLYKFPSQIPVYYPIKGIAEDLDNNIYLSQSLMHFSISGSLWVIKKMDEEDFYSKRDLNSILSYDDMINESDNSWIKSISIKELLGPLTFNKNDNCIYYYSSDGFFKIVNSNNNFSKVFILKPWIGWSAKNENRIGYDVNVLKFEFNNKNDLFFLTVNNGIGYFDGKSVKYFK
jgi:hypothetical protein